MEPRVIKIEAEVIWCLQNYNFPPRKKKLLYSSSTTKMQTASYLGFALLCSSASSSLGQAIGGRILIPRNKEMN